MLNANDRRKGEEPGAVPGRAKKGKKSAGAHRRSLWLLWQNIII